MSGGHFGRLAEIWSCLGWLTTAGRFALPSSIDDRQVSGMTLLHAAGAEPGYAEALDGVLLYRSVRGRPQIEEPLREADLREIYGPGWRECLALFRRASSLNGIDVERLSAAGGDRSEDDPFESGVPDLEAIGARYGEPLVPVMIQAVAELIAASVVPSDPGSVSGLIAESACALTFRSRLLSIGVHGPQYESLSGPWRRALGAIHPDDRLIAAPVM